MKYGGKQTTMTTSFRGESVTVRLDKPPIGGRIVDFKDYDWSKVAYQKAEMQEWVISAFTEQVEKYSTIASEVHFQFSSQPPEWVIEALPRGATYSVKP